MRETQKKRTTGLSVFSFLTPNFHTSAHPLTLPISFPVVLPLLFSLFFGTPIENPPFLSTLLLKRIK
jgi:hypothetical protein